MSISPLLAEFSASGSSLRQNAGYVGMNLQNILYGIELILYFKTVRILLANKGVRKKSDLFYALFSSIMVCLITVWVAALAIFGEKMWLLDSNYPGGPDIFWKENVSVWYMDWGTTAVILLQLMTDGLMIYRCLVVWNNYRVIVMPAFLWLSTLILGILVDYTSSSPGGDLLTGVSSQLALAYYTVSVFLNTILTCLICYRIVRHGKRVGEYLGNEHASFYFAVNTVVVESVLPYTLSGIAFLVSLGIGSPVSAALIPVYLLMMCISPQMLILRVLDRRAWESDTSMRFISTIKFDPGSGIDGTEMARVHLQGLSNAYPADNVAKSPQCV